MANLEQFENRIPDAWSVKLTLLLKITFYPTKSENRARKFLTQLAQKMLTSAKLRGTTY